MVIDSSSSKSASSSAVTERISMGGLPLPDFDDKGVSDMVPLAGISVSNSSTLFWTASVRDIVDGGVTPPGLREGDRGDEGIASRGCCDGVRTFIVTRLERGSEPSSAAGCWRSGVVGMVGPESIFMAESHLCSDADMPAAGELGEESSVSADRLRESLVKEVRRRFREERLSSSSSKGLGRVEQGSEEAARSLDGSAVEA